MTQIFKSYSDFSKRENKDTNGVSENFAQLNENWEIQNADNKACWNCSDCSDCSDCIRCNGCNGCSDCSDSIGCNDSSGCSDSIRCIRCIGCIGCSDCIRCNDCSDSIGCIRCSGTKGNLSLFNVPKIENIHQKVLESVMLPINALVMSDWHTCDTTHCWAGWITHLAGTEGKDLEQRTSTPFAAMQIVKASSPLLISPVRFFEDNETAMKNIKEYAQKEKELIQ